ncbi:DUF429 domain-containing protein [Bacillus benzoevorans]|uniref:Putative nuclease with RNAse H fold n=1 Tax=Bacillus benzoevorans TaxID=1456 RepID=A0A7X0LWF9_9BACI|nr:DUF429 domain-containing protein [Bacillus benzoevorans]MBB6445304.1 putative nuclease with RNAse H fold [Bacillus benzoevorans]
MKIIGIDLSGPANAKDTVMTVFSIEKGRLIFEETITNASDSMILTAIVRIAKNDEAVIGLDAPLSYQDGGGDRPQDKSIRQFIKGFGLVGGSIMPPTLTKMVYLSLRGIGLTRTMMMHHLLGKVRIVEVHPGAAIGTRIGPENLYHARNYKKEEAQPSRNVIFNWLQTVGLQGLPQEISGTSHQIDSCAAALAAWHWADPDKQPAWLWSETSPEHPFEFCC